VQKTSNKEYKGIVSPLYDFLNVFSDGQVVQKFLDNERN
jgi:hypothetical protein